jgi:penicillin amidase
MIATGQSGHPLSPHYGDMTERWQAGETFTISGTPAELAAGGLGLTTLHPTP